MSRVKFRAWHKGVMINNCDVINGCLAIMESPKSKEKESIQDEEGHWYYHDWDAHKSYPLSPLMQYTGLKDKNGIEIYEGDILKHPSGEVFQVKWFLGYCAFRALYKDDSSNLALQINEKGLAEVIGNIHQHPELLDKENAN